MISVIIPVYNTQIESIINQKYHDIEIIIVDDGSPLAGGNDYSAILLLDNRIEVIKQKHKGVSAARNTGLKMAKGKYVAFVDGDDMITSTFFSEAIAIAEKYASDIVIGGIQIVYNDNDKEECIENDTVYTFEDDSVKNVRRSLLQLPQTSLPYTVLGSPSARIIKKDLLSNIRFREDISIFEDQVFNREILLYAKKVAYLHHVWYQYYQYENSSLHSAAKRFNSKFLNQNLLQEWNRLNIEEFDKATKNELCV